MYLWPVRDVEIRAEDPPGSTLTSSALYLALLLNRTDQKSASSP